MPDTVLINPFLAFSDSFKGLLTFQRSWGQKVDSENFVTSWYDKIYQYREK